MSQQVQVLSNLKQIREIISVYRKVWPMSIGIIDLLSSSSECFILPDEDGKVIGYAFVEADPERGFVELQDLAVSPDHQYQKGGHFLMKAIMGKYHFIKLIARAQNERLIDFYRRLGFEVECLIENYYEINQDGLRMVWRA